MQSHLSSLKRLLADKAGSPSTLLRNRALVLPLVILALPKLTPSEKLIIHLAKIQPDLMPINPKSLS
jgi:hypothetical protein